MRSRVATTAMALVVLLGAPGAAGAPDAASGLERVNRLIEELEYDAALEALEALAAVPDRTRELTLELYRLRGVVAGTLSRQTQAERAFRALLMLDFGAALDPSQPPRVQTPFFQAKSWVSERGPIGLDIDVKQETPDSARLAVRVLGDALGLGKAVSLELQGSPAQTVRLGRSGVASVRVRHPTSLSWSATLLGERGSTLLTATGRADGWPAPASQTSSGAAVTTAGAQTTGSTPPVAVEAVGPTVAGQAGRTASPGSISPPLGDAVSRAGPASPPAEDGPGLEPAPPSEQSAATETDAPSSAPPTQVSLRTMGVSLGALGLAALVTGAVLGVRVQAAHTTLARAERDADGVIVGMTQREAAWLDARARTEAPVANALLGAGVGLAGACAVLLAVDAARPAAVVVPTGQGLAVVGSF